MGFERIWQHLCRKEPELQKPGTKIEFESQNLKALLLQVYEKGRESAPKARNPFEGWMK